MLKPIRLEQEVGDWYRAFTGGRNPANSRRAYQSVMDLCATLLLARDRQWAHYLNVDNVSCSCDICEELASHRKEV
jgi:hypothetical protein